MRASPTSPCKPCASIVDNTPPPPGVKAYVTGAAPLAPTSITPATRGIKLITAVTICVIFVMLLFVYRSIVTVLLVLVMVFLELAAARGIVASLGYYDLIGLSTFAVNLLTTLAIAAGTDYAIFLLGRYHEARKTARTAKPPSTRCITAPPTSSWARV